MHGSFQATGRQHAAGAAANRAGPAAGKRQGIKTVIDFRLPSETPAPNAELASRSGLDYVNIPVNKASLSRNQIDELDRVMQEKEGPFLIHCASGARAALLLVLSKAKKNNWTAERAFEEARTMGFDFRNSRSFQSLLPRRWQNDPR
jgi:uncharacterized protein (TIGR01244 family)